MGIKLTDKIVAALPRPATGNKLYFDTETKGFAARVTANGARAFVLTYRRKGDGVQKRWTIGDFPDWTAEAARKEAQRLKVLIDNGGDPVGEFRLARGAPTV